MKMFENNPVGMALAWAIGGLGILSLFMLWAWYWPVQGSDAEMTAEAEALGQVAIQATELGPISEYNVVNDRPLFNESRQPVVVMEEDGEGIEIVDAVVADAPDVRLTGVIITPDQRIATLAQNQGGDPLIAHEGTPLDGPYVGWTVATVEPRKVRLESSEGEAFELELAVHDQIIREPPKPEPPPEAVAQADNDGEDTAGDKPLSRAEEIRRRIAERREQLRREADQERAEEGSANESQASEYQAAIQNMLQRSSTSSDNGKSDESGSDNDD